MLSRQLKAATQDLHKHAEDANFSDRIMDGTLELPQYATLLRRNYWFNFNLEQRAHELKLNQLFPALELHTRLKSPLLEKDLQQLGAWPAARPAADFPVLQADELLGGLYVSEGSTLGGQIIRKALRRNSAFDDVPRSAFFTGYGEMTGERWRSFITALDDLTDATPYLTQAAIKGARQMFTYFIALGTSDPAQVNADITEVDSKQHGH